ncbi:MAG: RadC family protein [Armatimonadota bacterium]
MEESDFLQPSLKLQDMPTDSRPREKMHLRGVNSLEDHELLAILLRVGMKGKNVVQMAQEILSELGDTRQIAQRPPDDLLMELTSIPGVGPAKACQIVAAIELGRRVERSQLNPKEQIDLADASSAKQYLQSVLRYEESEMVLMLILDSHHRLKTQRVIFRGTVAETFLSPREVYSIALRLGAAGIMLAHNHPSGDPSPSTADIMATKRIKQAGEMIGIPLIDHIVVGDPDVISMKCAGIM